MKEEFVFSIETIDKTIDEFRSGKVAERIH
jgi:hypothetical protein